MMTPTAWFITIWAGLCVYAIYCAIRDWNKDPQPKKKTYEQTVDEINARAQWQFGKSVNECRKEVRRWDGHIF